MPQRVEGIQARILTVEGESGAQQAVVAPPVMALVAVAAAAAAVETEVVSRGGARLARRGAPGDTRRACSAPRQPSQEHVDQGPQNQSDCHGNAESYDQRDWKKEIMEVSGSRMFSHHVNNTSFLRWLTLVRSKPIFGIDIFSHLFIHIGFTALDGEYQLWRFCAIRMKTV